MTNGYISNNGEKNLTSIGVLREYNPDGNINEVDETKRLSTRLTIKDKYNNGCSEGFYLYLFSETSPGFIPKKIYMKVEFNHAGLGRTIPFIMPVNDEYVPYDPINNDGFPITYVKLDSKNVDGTIINEESIDMKRLYKDMFIEILTKYDEINNEYVLYLPSIYGYNNGKNYENKFNGKIVFNLFEPKIQ